ncbi:MAG: 30S ribosomal protein S2 [Phycisphaerae bacterium]|nr:30S ribosomal protein S2 [Phycisphaerae bacterium]
MASELVRNLIDSGIHFGHRVSRWNPKMAPYIFGKRNLIHIIDIRETVKGLLRAKKFIAQVVANGEQVLFVGTKRQARHTIEQHSSRVGMPCVTERWLGGMLTNFRTVRSRLGRLEELEQARADGSALQYSKKAIAAREREERKIHRNLAGVRDMNKLPGALLVVDVGRERIAVREAKKLGIPTICLIDTDSDPDFADIPIPGNDDAIRSIEVIVEHLADAVEVGKRAKPPEESDSREGRRRSSRPTMGRADGDKPSQPPEAQAPQVTKPEKPAEAPAKPVPAEPAPVAEAPAEAVPVAEVPAEPVPAEHAPAEAGAAEPAKDQSDTVTGADADSAEGTSSETTVSS